MQLERPVGGLVLSKRPKAARLVDRTRRARAADDLHAARHGKCTHHRRSEHAELIARTQLAAVVAPPCEHEADGGESERVLVAEAKAMDLVPPEARLAARPRLERAVHEPTPHPQRPPILLTLGRNRRRTACELDRLTAHESGGDGQPVAERSALPAQMAVPGWQLGTPRQQLDELADGGGCP